MNSYSRLADSLPGARRHAVHSQFNTNCVRPDKCACAAALSSLFPAHIATLLAADTKFKRHFRQLKVKEDPPV